MQDERSLLNYFALTFVISWLVFIPTFLTWIGISTPIGGDGYNGFASFFSTFGPPIAALILLGRIGGWRMAWALIKSGFDFRTNPFVLAAAFLLPIAVAKRNLVGAVTLSVLCNRDLASFWEVFC